MADAKICDCCGKVVTDLHEARMHVFYFGDQDDGGGGFFRVRRQTPKMQVDLCGKCWDKIRGFAGGEDDGK